MRGNPAFVARSREALCGDEAGSSVSVEIMNVSKPLNRPDRGRRFEPRPDSTFRGPTRALWAAFLLAMMSLAAGGEATAIETLGYRTVREDGPFEIRRVEPHIVAATFVAGDFDDVGSVGFRRLFEYISGLNRSEAKIAMTAPVTQTPSDAAVLGRSPVTQEGSDGRFRITFVMPAEYTLDTLPVPADERIVLQAEESRTVAALRYSGFWTRSRYRAHERKLRDWIALQDLETVGAPVWARYDPPFMPWFLRRNEILITVREP